AFISPSYLETPRPNDLGLAAQARLHQPWFRVILRIGETGTHEDFLDPGRVPSPDETLQETITAARSGELFVYVNDAVLAVPSLQDLFYRNNSGTAEISLERR